MEKKKRQFRFPVRLKTILIIVVFGLVLSEIAMIYFTIVSNNKNKTTYKALATDLSRTVALSIDKEKVKNVTDQIVSYYDACETKPTRDQEGTAEYSAYMANIALVKQTQDYIDLSNYLNSVKEANTDTKSIYLGYVDYDRKLTVYISYDEEDEYYTAGTVDVLYEEDYPIIENHKLGFVASIYTDEYEGVYLVTAGAPIVDANDEVNCYALVDISMDVVRKKQSNSIVRLFIYLIGTVVLLSIIGVVVINILIIKPLKMLQRTALSYDANNPELTHLKFTSLKLYVHDELTDLADSMKKMENDVNNKINELTQMNAELIASQQVAEKMTELANKDALTGVRNKIAYDVQVEELNEKIKNKQPLKFGVVMIDLNYLKSINDDYGHDSGDSALIKLCNLVCTIFAHSPVYRVGGDEFVVILKGRDYEHADKLVEEFNRKIDELGEDDELLPSEKVSAAIGVAKFHAKKDNCVDDVFKRADKAMYARKHEMKEHDK